MFCTNITNTFFLRWYNFLLCFRSALIDEQTIYCTLLILECYFWTLGDSSAIRRGLNYALERWQRKNKEQKKEKRQTTCLQIPDAKPEYKCAVFGYKKKMVVILVQFVWYVRFWRFWKFACESFQLWGHMETHTEKEKVNKSIKVKKEHYALESHEILECNGFRWCSVTYVAGCMRRDLGRYECNAFHTWECFQEQNTNHWLSPVGRIYANHFMSWWCFRMS